MAVKKKTVKKKTAARKKPAVRRKTKTAAKKKPAARKKTARKAVKAVKKVKKAKRKSSGRKSGLAKMTYTVSDELHAIVGSKTLTRPEIVKKLWHYIKAHKCQHATNRRMIVPDAKLAKVIGNKPVDMLKLAGLLSKHIK